VRRRSLIIGGTAILLAAGTHLGPLRLQRGDLDPWKEQTLMILFPLTESGGKEGLPLVTTQAS
jgi:hypothetical protein